MCINLYIYIVFSQQEVSRGVLCNRQCSQATCIYIGACCGVMVSYEYAIGNVSAESVLDEDYIHIGRAIHRRVDLDRVNIATSLRHSVSVKQVNPIEQNGIILCIIVGKL